MRNVGFRHEKKAMRITITMCHGLSEGKFDSKRRPLTVDGFEEYFAIAIELGFRSISHDDLARWRDGDATKFCSMSMEWQRRQALADRRYSW